MQNFNKFNDTDYISDAPSKLNNNFDSVKSDFAGTTFPTTDLVEGMTCYRTDMGVEYRYNGSVWLSPIATQAEAESGTDNTKVMTPKGVDYRLNKDRQLKVYRSLPAIGITDTTNLTMEDVLNALPSYSQLFIEGSSAVASIFPNGSDYYGVLQMVRFGGSRTSVFFTSSGGKSYYGWFKVGSWSGWKKLANTDDIPAFSTQAQAEAGTDNTTVMTPLSVKNSKSIGSKENRLTTINFPNHQGGTLNTFHCCATSTAIEGKPSNGDFNIFQMNWDSVTGYDTQIAQCVDKNEMFIRRSNNVGEWQDWTKIATNGALSMPSDNSINIGTSATSYTAPCDGWVSIRVKGVSGGSNSYIMEANGLGYLIRQLWDTSATMGSVLPLAKGNTVSIALSGGCEITSLLFFYAQSEV